MSLLHEIARSGQAGRTAAYDCDFLSRGRRLGQVADIQVALFIVRDEAFKISNAQRLNLFSHQTTAFAVIFLRTNTSCDGREHIVFADFGSRAQEVAGYDQLHEVFHLDSNWTIVRALRLGALQAAQRFLPRQLLGIAQVYFSKIRSPQQRRLLQHALPGNLHPFFEEQNIQRWWLRGLGHRLPPCSAHAPACPVCASCWNSSIDFCSAVRYIELRCTSTEKSTRCASNSGPSTHANSLFPSTSTRQPPHMPVPSIMIGFRLTMVRMCSFRVISATARIMGMGPIASTRSMRVPFSINWRSLSVTKPLSA